MLLVLSFLLLQPQHMHWWVKSLTEHGVELVAPSKAEHHIVSSCNIASNVVSNACWQQCFQNFILGCRRSLYESLQSW